MPEATIAYGALYGTIYLFQWGKLCLNTTFAQRAYSRKKREYRPGLPEFLEEGKMG